MRSEILAAIFVSTLYGSSAFAHAPITAENSLNCWRQYDPHPRCMDHGKSFVLDLRRQSAALNLYDMHLAVGQALCLSDRCGESLPLRVATVGGRSFTRLAYPVGVCPPRTESIRVEGDFASDDVFEWSQVNGGEFSFARDVAEPSVGGAVVRLNRVSKGVNYHDPRPRLVWWLPGPSRLIEPMSLRLTCFNVRLDDGGHRSYTHEHELAYAWSYMNVHSRESLYLDGDARRAFGASGWDPYDGMAFVHYPILTLEGDEDVRVQCEQASACRRTYAFCYDQDEVPRAGWDAMGFAREAARPTWASSMVRLRGLHSFTSRRYRGDALTQHVASSQVSCLVISEDQIAVDVLR